MAAGIGFAAVRCAKKSEAFQKKLFFVLWLLMLVTEPLIVLWEAGAGREFFIDWRSALSYLPGYLKHHTAEKTAV